MENNLSVSALLETKPNWRLRYLMTDQPCLNGGWRDWRWRSWPVLSLGSCMQEHTGAACDRGTKRQTNWWEMDQVTRWLEHKAGHGWPWSCYTLSPPAAGHPAALWLSLLTTRAYTLHPYYRSLLYIIISVPWYHCTYYMNNITQPYLFLKVSLK